MNELYPRWVAAHGVLIVSPVYWYQAPSVLKLMMDRLVCADGGNPDPTTTHGKRVEEAKALELAGWSYPKHLAGRAFGVVVHGDTEGAETLRRNLPTKVTRAGAEAPRWRWDSVRTLYAVTWERANYSLLVSLPNHEDRRHAPTHAAAGVHGRALAPGRGLFRSD